MNPQRLLKLWQQLETRPFGKKIFTYFLGKRIPYTGTISSEVQELRAGYCRIQLREHKKVQNHLHSVHAVALVNVAEFTTGLACTTSLPPSGRIILKSLQMDYLKKARGLLVAEASTPVISEEIEKTDVSIEAKITNEAGEVVAKLTALWQVGCPKK